MEALAGDVISVSIDTPDSGVNPYVELRSAGDGVLASDNDGGPDTDALISQYVISSSGSYFVRVGKDSGSTVAGAYELRLELARGIHLEADNSYFNDGMGGASLLRLTEAGTHSRATAATLTIEPGIEIQVTQGGTVSGIYDGDKWTTSGLLKAGIGVT